MTREKTTDQVRSEFELALTRYGESGSLNEDGFLAYHASISATIPAESDEYFVGLLVDTWGVNLDNVLPSGRTLESLTEILNEKIRQRTHTNEDEGKIVLRTFNYVDRDGSGAISYEEFKQALDQWGCAFTDEEALALFNHYDLDKSGFLVSEEFAHAFASKGASGSHQFNGRREPPNSIIDKVRKELLKRGLNGVRGLGLVFKRLDSNRNGTLSKNEFDWALRDNGHLLDRRDLDRLFNYFDKNRNGKVSYPEFLDILRGQLNDARKALVIQAYKKLLSDGNGQVTSEILRSQYDPSSSADLKSGRKTRDQIISEFLSLLETHNGLVPENEFENYYKDLSVGVPRDDEFEDLLRSTWHIEAAKPKNTTQTSLRSTRR